MLLEYLRLSYLIYPASPAPGLLFDFHKSHPAPIHLLLFCVLLRQYMTRIKVPPKRDPVELAQVSRRLGPYVKHGRVWKRHRFLSSADPFPFCHLSTSQHCGNPSQVGTKWVTQGESQLEHKRLCVRYLRDSAPTWAYKQTLNVFLTGFPLQICTKLKQYL